MSEKQTINIDVVSDVMCPWCYIGKTNLDKAISEMKDIDVKVTWRPYQLDESLPKEGKDRAEYLNNKFGGEAGAQEVYGRIKDAGKAHGIDFNFEDMKVSPNTLDAHRVIMWAGGQSPEIQDKLVERLFELFFLEGANIGLDEVLIDAAKHAGMDGDIVESLLKKDDDKDVVAAQVSHARSMGVTGVPFFIFDGRVAVPGAAPVEQLVGAARHAIENPDVGKQEA